MENGAATRENGSGALMFSDEELRDIYGLRRIRDDHVDVTCGCTSRQYGDAVGILRIFLNGDLEINCDCRPGCQEDKLTPAAFEKHSGRETARKWKKNVWVIVNGEKVPLAKTALLKYYFKALKSGNSQNGRVCHQDEFVRCTDSECGKQRRFHRRNKEECRAYHDASMNTSWKCSDTPSEEEINCETDEERTPRLVYRGCSRSQTCKGCTTCVCFGCTICRFSDCSCQSCIDFTRNAKI